MLDRDDYLDLARGLAVGQTGRFSHDACGDTRKRLYVTRGKEGMGPNDILAFCHNCGVGGRASLGTVVRSHVPKSGTGVAVPAATFSLPPATSFDLRDFTPDVIGWLRSYDLLGELPHPWVGCDRATGSVLLPLWSKDRGLEAYQTRSFDPRWKGPKYLTRKREGARTPQPYQLTSTNRDLVLCEDSLSAIKVAMAGEGYTGAPLWSAPASNPHLVELVKPYPYIWVWFDNDNEIVRANAVALGRRLRAYHPNVRVILDRKDPKWYTVEQIKEILNHG